MTRFSTFAGLLTAAALAGASTQASAATLVFDFTSLGSINTSGIDTYSQTVSGLTLNVKGYRNIFSTVNLGTQDDVTRSGLGLGVDSYDSNQLNLGDQSGTDPGDGLLFDFGQAVTLLSVEFGDFADFDDADYAYGNPASGTLLDISSGLSGSTWTTSLLGQQFFLAAIDDGNTCFGFACFGDNDSFRIKSMTVSYTPGGGGADPAPAVPEPSTWAMMILGFGLVGAAMRKKQRQTVAYNFA